MEIHLEVVSIALNFESYLKHSATPQVKRDSNYTTRLWTKVNLFRYNVVGSAYKHGQSD